MTAKIFKPDFEHNGSSIINPRQYVTQAREIVAAHPPKAIMSKLLAAWLWVTMCGLGDFGVMLDLQSSAFTDPLGNFNGNTAQLVAVSLLTLAIFVFIAHSWQSLS